MAFAAGNGALALPSVGDRDIAEEELGVGPSLPLPFETGALLWTASLGAVEVMGRLSQDDLAALAALIAGLGADEPGACEELGTVRELEDDAA